MTSQPGSQTIKIYTFPNISRSIGKQTMKSDKNLNILKRKRAFKVKLKAFFIIFKGLSVAKNCLSPESAPLTFVSCKNRQKMKSF